MKRKNYFCKTKANKVSIDTLKDVIDDCHQEAKKLFFDLLNEKLLNSLNPEFNK